jgi:DNA-binding MarR family transcriptional regulator
MTAPTSSAERNDDVALTAADARELARLLGLLVREHPLVAAEVAATLRRVKAAKGSALDPADRRQLVLKVRAVMAERKRRTNFFGNPMFGEAAWDMLLALYITDFAGRRQTISKLVDWANAPRSTANRWMDYLEKERLIARSPHPNDRRFTLVDLTEKGRRLLDEYFGTLPDDVSSV